MENAHIVLEIWNIIQNQVIIFIMTLSDLISDIQTKRRCGRVSIQILDRSYSKDWEEELFEKIKKDFLSQEMSLEDFKKNLDKVTRNIASQIIISLLHKDMAYEAKIMKMSEAKEFANHFFSFFDKDALYYSNSDWNKNKYSKDEKFKFGLGAYNPLTDSTFDSGVIICDSKKIGIAWFQDED